MLFFYELNKNSIICTKYIEILYFVHKVGASIIVNFMHRILHLLSHNYTFSDIYSHKLTLFVN